MAPVNSSSWPRRPSLMRCKRVLAERLVLEERPRHRRLDERRRQRVDADLVRRELDRHRLGEALHGVLGGAIDRAASAPPTWPICDDMLMIEPGCFASIRRARHRLRHEKGGAHVEREDEVEILDLHVDERRRPVGAGIVDQDVERRLRGDRRLHRVDVAHVERERRRPVCPRARIASAASSISFARARGERHMRAGVGQRGGGGQPDAAPAAGHQRAPAVEAEGGRLGEVDALSSRRVGRWDDRLNPHRGSRITPPPGRRARCGRRSGARGYWPARRGR